MSTRWIRASVAAKAVGVSERKIWALMRNGTLSPRPWSRPLEVSRASVRRLIFERQPMLKEFIEFVPPSPDEGV
jgi:hypothetical protein